MSDDLIEAAGKAGVEVRSEFVVRGRMTPRETATKARLSTEGQMPDLRIGQTVYRLSDPAGEVALAHAIGRAFVELQQLEFSIISYLNNLSGGSVDSGASFDVFASKTFGNLVREMRKHTFLERLGDEMQIVKEKRDFFVHKFLFHRYGGPMMTRDDEYEQLIHEARGLGRLFSSAARRFDDFMLDKSSIAMFVATVDPETGEMSIRESVALRARPSS